MVGVTRPSLTELADHHGSDKGTVGPTPKWRGHLYTLVYERYLEQLRDQPISLLEIGIGAGRAKIKRGRNSEGGASLKMWRDYFPRARIYGLDMFDASYLDDERVRTFQGDQSDLGFLAEVAAETGPLDVIIDDGSHWAVHQQMTLGFLFGHVRPGGLYFIEDLLANGRGDKMQGRMATDEVLNTRAVLKGRYAEPNRLPPDFPPAEIDFHCPREDAEGEMLAVLRRP
jgi:hypothetical protein